MTLLTRLEAAESYLRAVALYALTASLRHEASTHADAVAEARAALYEKGCREGTGERDANNPEFVRDCGPAGAPDAP
jgi:hypothetical protein